MKPNRELLKDLTILIGRYSSDDWKQVSLILEDEESRRHIVAALKALENLSKASKGPDRSIERRPQPAHMRSVGREDAAEYGRLATKLDQMPTSQLKEFAAKSNIRVSRKDSRKRVIGRLLAAFPKHGGSIGRGPVLQKKKAREGDYGKWVKIIMGAR